MDKLFVSTTVGFPFKKACLSEPDASWSNNRSIHTVTQAGKGYLGVGNGERWRLQYYRE